MGSLFQSAHMKLVQIIDRNDAARAVISELGEHGIFQFRDMNSGLQFFKRTFSDDVRRCDDIQRRLLKLKKQLDAVQLLTHPRHEEGLRVPLPELDAQISTHEAELKELSTNVNALRRNHNSLREQKLVLEVCNSLYAGTVGSAAAPEAASGSRFAPASTDPISPPETPSVLSSLVQNEFSSSADDGMLQYIVGMIPRAKAHTFERVVFRTTRGNCMVHNVPVDDDDLLDASDHKGEAVALKNVFLIFFSGGVLKQKLGKICNFFGCQRYSLPEVRAAAAQPPRARLPALLPPACARSHVLARRPRPRPRPCARARAAQTAEMRRALLAEVTAQLSSSTTVLDRALQLQRVCLDNVAHHWAEWNYTTLREKMTFNGARGAARCRARRGAVCSAAQCTRGLRLRCGAAAGPLRAAAARSTPPAAARSRPEPAGVCGAAVGTLERLWRGWRIWRAPARGRRLGGAVVRRRGAAGRARLLRARAAAAG